MDTFSYLLTLKKIIFNDKDKNKISLTIVSNNLPQNKEKEAMPVMVIVTSEVGIEYEIYNTYYLFTSENKIEIISKNKLNDLFKNRTFEYLDYDDYISGIKNGNTKKLV